MNARGSGARGASAERGSSGMGDGSAIRSGLPCSNARVCSVSAAADHSSACRASLSQTCAGGSSGCTERLVSGAAMPCGMRSASQGWRSSRDAPGRSLGFLRGGVCPSQPPQPDHTYRMQGFASTCPRAC